MLDQIEEEEQASAITLHAWPHDVTEAGKAFIAELPSVKEDFESFARLACDDWTQLIDERLIKKAMHMHESLSHTISCMRI